MMFQIFLTVISVLFFAMALVNVLLFVLWFGFRGVNKRLEGYRNDFDEIRDSK